MADTPGDGTTNPFTEGTGGGMGNNFLTNPKGTPGRGGGGQPASYGESRVQRVGVDPDINEADIPDGGKDLMADPTGDAGGNPVGAGSVGNPQRPFKGLSNPHKSGY